MILSIPSGADACSLELAFVLAASRIGISLDVEVLPAMMYNSA